MSDRSLTTEALIVGGGIVGAGVARDAAMRGLTTVLVDANDFAFGTSSRSSRLLHGGLRYLAQGRVGLVREASHEKIIISKIAPHLVAPLSFVFPTYKGTQWKRWKLRIGVKIYDWLCGKSNLGSATGLTPEQAIRILPMLEPVGLTGGVRYFDGFTNDARLVLDTLRSAADAGATLLNYTSLQSATRDGQAWQCVLRDAHSGQERTIQARTVVNAAGAWAQRFPKSQVKLRLTKGVHLVVHRAKLPVSDAVVMTDGSRILFAIPWGERLILGTTDTDYEGATENPKCDDDDVAYVLAIANKAFPTSGISASDVISAWAGLRPLIADADAKPSDISRAHQIHAQRDGWIDVAGGKLTTYRLMAEQTVDAVASVLGKAKGACRTAVTPLVNDISFSGITPPAVSREAVDHFCAQEWSRHLDDVMIRRTSWRYYHRDHLEIAERVAAWMAAKLNWSTDRTADELKRYRRMTAPLAPAWEPVDTLASRASSP